MLCRRSLLTSLVVLGLLASGCGTTRTVAPVASAPPATSATGAVNRFEFAFNHRDVDAIAGLLSDDAVFLTAGEDSAGSMSSQAWNRERLLLALHAMLQGDPPVRPVADRASLTFDRPWVESVDPRPGRSPLAHRTIRTSVTVIVAPHDESGLFEAQGYLQFYVTRGDSAQIPTDQQALGVTATPTRWWIERIEDGTLPWGGYHTTPASPTWFGLILAYYDAWIAIAAHSPSADLRRRS